MKIMKQIEEVVDHVHEILKGSRKVADTQIVYGRAKRLEFIEAGWHLWGSAFHNPLKGTDCEGIMMVKYEPETPVTDK